MNKGELISAMAQKSGLKKNVSENALNALLDTVQDALKANEKVVLVGFGTFERRARAARKGIDPRTKKPIDIPATSAPVFKAGKDLKDRVQGKK
jgi:DNA-binding protein HU-beta